MAKQINLVINGKGGVGKSFFAMNFVQYLKDRDIAHCAIDSDHENSTLKRFHPESDFINLEHRREIDRMFIAQRRRWVYPKRRRLSLGHPMLTHALARVAWPIPSNSRDVSDQLASHPLRATRMRYLLPPATKALIANRPTNSPQQWEQINPGRVSIYEFPEAFGVPHDMIDSNQPDAKTQITYPKVLSGNDPC